MVNLSQMALPLPNNVMENAYEQRWLESFIESLLGCSLFGIYAALFIRYNAQV